MEHINSTEIKRPVFLKVLVVLSCIYIGLSIIGSLGAIIRGPYTTAEIDEAQVEAYKSIDEMNEVGYTDFAEIMSDSLRIEHFVNDNIYVNSILTLIILGFGLYGVISMYNGKKRGFHIYIIYNLLASTVIYVSVPMSNVPVTFLMIGLGISALFVWMYSRNLKFMKD